MRGASEFYSIFDNYTELVVNVLHVHTMFTHKMRIAAHSLGTKKRVPAYPHQLTQLQVLDRKVRD